MSLLSKPAGMAVFIVTNLGNGQFYWSFQNNAELGFPTACSVQSGRPLSKTEVKEAFIRLLDECMPENT
jgi:hypothetical protein